jgi:polyhydroxyalkanoate synthesis repressor PhaR
MTPPIVVKKYGNRRLYDTEESRYVTLEELAEKVRRGTDVRVLEAKTSEDLTQATLAQIILESRGASRRLPISLLVQLIRMDDEALAEFLGRWVSSALELYVQAKHGAQVLSPYVPMAHVPFAATNALARLLVGAGAMLAPSWDKSPPPAALGASGSDTPPPPPPEGWIDGSSEPATSSEIDALRRELDELRRSIEGGAGAKAARRKRR